MYVSMWHPIELHSDDTDKAGRSDTDKAGNTDTGQALTSNTGQHKQPQPVFYIAGQKRGRS